MQQFLEDIRATIGKVETFEKTNKIYINGIPFVPVKQKILDGLRKNGDIVISSEISRIGRRLILVLEFIKICTEKGVNFYTVKDRYKIEDSIQSKVILTVMGLCSEIERDLIRQRTREGLARTRAAGTILGRPKGRKSSKVKLTGYEDMICKLSNLGNSQRKIAKSLHVDRNTLSRFIKDKGIILNQKEDE